MNAMEIERGLLADGLPFVRLGSGRRTMAIFPGLADAAWDVTSPKWDFPSQFSRLADKFRLYIISRRRGLPQGYTTRNMAADYARAFEQRVGPAIVLGISLGGYVAQHFAADYPDYVEQLVIASAAHRVSEEGRRTPELWLALANENRWREFYRDIARVTIQEYSQKFSRFLAPLVRRPVCNPADFLVSLEACLAHDSAESLPRIQAPTLLIGGTKDLFFPPSLLQEAARRIPNAMLRYINGAGHSAYVLRRAEFEDAVMEYLQPRVTLVSETTSIPAMINVEQLAVC
jgi:pimeloyl-ACP methyl ester carboxylesterase